MKNYLFGLIGLALLHGSPLLAQEPMPVPNAPGGGPPGVPVVMDSPAACCPATKTICVREEYIKKTEKRVYSCGSEPLCLPYHFSLFSLFSHGDCESCHCGPPYTRRWLIVKIKTVEKCDTRCVAREVPACEPCGCGSAPLGSEAVSPGARTPEPIPAPAPGKPELIPAPAPPAAK